MTEGARIVRVRLNYGNQRDVTRSFPQDGRPVVISGPNGSGKTTLLEAVARTLYGFNRRSESALLEARMTALESGWCEIRIRRPDGVEVDVRRNFDDVKAVITTVDGREELFKGDANAAGTNEQSRRFREAIHEIIGLADYEDFRKTVFVEQGSLVAGTLSDELLRIASGGTGRVDDAIAEIEDRYFALTKQALPGESRGKNKNRRLERLLDRRRELREALRETGEQESNRRPIAEEIRHAEEEIGRLNRRIAVLEAAHARLQSERGRQAERELAMGRIREATRVRERLREARQAAEAAEGAFALHGTHCGPEEVEAAGERARRALEAWAAARQARADEDRRGSPGEMAMPGSVWAAGAVAGVAAVLAVALGQPALWAIAVVAALFAVAQHRAHRRRLESGAEENARLLERLDAEVEAASAALSQSRATLGMDDEVEHLDRRIQEVERDARALLESKKALEESERLARETWKELAEAMDGATDVPEGRTLADSLRACEEHFRQVKVSLDMEGGESEVELPDDVEPTADAVGRALATARSELASSRNARDLLHRRLAEEATPSLTSAAIRDELDELGGEIDAVEARVRSLRLARELLQEAQEAFRDGDEGRLLDLVSKRAKRLSRDQIGPVESPGALSEARVQVVGRVVALGSPGLSYGERVAIGLALRLGATDFLAGAGIRPPLLIDEPFDDLDPERAAGVWSLLQEIARERQVILTSQNPLTLQHLGVTPDIRLAGRGLHG